MTVREEAATAYRQALPALAASTVGGLFAGLVLGGMRGELRQVQGLLVLVPALLATRGNVYGALGARLATGLHQGVLSPDVSLADERLRRAVTAAMANGVFVSGVAALVAVAALAALGRPVAPPARLVAIALVAGLLSGVLLTVAVVTVVVAGFRRGHDPDTLVGPIVTTTGDVFGLACLVAAVWLVEVVA